MRISVKKRKMLQQQAVEDVYFQILGIELRSWGDKFVFMEEFFSWIFRN